MRISQTARVPYGSRVRLDDFQATEPVTTRATLWPSNGRLLPPEALPWLLARSARFHARQALSKFTSETDSDRLQAAIGTGSATELLAKAYVASVEPTLLTERADRDSLLVLAGKGHIAEGVDPTQIRTISATTALSLTKHLLRGSFPYQPATDDVVLAVRNAAIHLGVVSEKSLIPAVRSMTRLVKSLLSPLDIDPQEFWGDVRRLSDQLVKEALDEVRVVVSAKRTAALMRFQRLTRGLDSAAREAVLSTLSGREVASEREHNEMEPCPVCEQYGWLGCDVYYGATETEFEPDGNYAGTWTDRIAVPVVFECPVCRFKIENQELEQFGFKRQIELDPIEGYYADWEPDEGWLAYLQEEAAGQEPAPDQ